MGVKYSTSISDTSFIKMRFFVFFCLLIALASAQPRGRGKSRAAARPNCKCQCIDYTWRNKYGVVQGNCESGEIAPWCYVGSFDCTDVKFEVDGSRWSGRIWSYQACSTPAPWDPKCNRG